VHQENSAAPLRRIAGILKGKENPVLHQNEKLKLKIASTVFQQIKDAGLIDDRKSYSVDDLARMYNITRDAAVLVTKMLEAA
jgi:fructose-1,6-bisphosphatase/sedoheptulose 1,7-bisphosphatase-like protein